MSVELDLRDLHQPHEPDPDFVRALEQRLEGVLRTAGDDPAITDDPAIDANTDAVDHYVQPPATRPAPRRWIIRAALGAAAAIVLVTAIGVLVRRDDRSVIEPFKPVPAANGWVAQPFGSGVWTMRDDASEHQIDVPGTANEVCPAFSPDGERLMFGHSISDSGAGSLAIVTIAADGDGAPLRTIPLDGVDGSPCALWAPDGRWAALGGNGEVLVVDTETAEVRHLPGYNPRDLEWRPGTDELAITGRDIPGRGGGDIENTPIDIYSVSTGEVRTIDDVEAAELTWSPDGTTIAYTQVEPGETNVVSGITLIDADGTDPRPLTTDDYVADHGIGVVWSPLGDHIAYQRARTNCTGDACFELSEVVLVTATDTDPDKPIGTERVIPPVVDNLDTANFGEVFNHSPPFRSVPWDTNSVTWSPDGTQLLYLAESEAVIVVPVDAARPAFVLSGDSLMGSYDDRSTSPWIPLQQWQPLP